MSGWVNRTGNDLIERVGPVARVNHDSVCVSELAGKPDTQRGRSSGPLPVVASVSTNENVSH